jgi:hypothetical protein
MVQINSASVRLDAEGYLCPVAFLPHFAGIAALFHPEDGKLD